MPERKQRRFLTGTCIFDAVRKGKIELQLVGIPLFPLIQPRLFGVFFQCSGVPNSTLARTD
jgi:hypothetical protein